MPVQVATGAMMMCTFGVAPAVLNATPTGVEATTPAATIMDMVPMENIPTFGMCMSIANPEVAAATTAAFGVLTPMPCIPATVAPWAPGAVTTTIAGMPALHNACMCNCMWAGVITITDPGQVIVQVT